MNWRGDDINEILSSNSNFTSFEATGISIDSRTIKAGEIFIALRGESFDGYEYIADALDKGAVAIIVEQFYPIPDGVALFEVQDTLQALQQLAEHAREKLDCKVIGITGSVGKTTAKEMLLQAFSAYGKTHASHGNFNNHIGLPLVLVNCPEVLDFLILEMGMNNGGEIEFLTKLAKPDLAIITNVKAAHMANFRNIEAVANAKAEIFSSTPTQALLLGDDGTISPILLQAANSANVKDIRTFAIDDNELTHSCHYKLQKVKVEKKPKITASLQGQSIEYKIGMLGRSAVINSMIAFSAVDMVMGNLDKLDILEDFDAPKGRGAISKIKFMKEGKKAILIDESYNASPSAVVASLGLLADVKRLYKGKRSVAILGDMLELGAEELNYHASLLADLKFFGIDKLITVGVRMKHLYDSAPASQRLVAYDDSDSLLEDIWKYIKADDVLLLKGSHSMGLEKIVLHLQQKRG